MTSRADSTSASSTETDIEKPVIPKQVADHGHHAQSVPNNDPLELPYETLRDDADMREFTTETVGGTILHEAPSNRTGKVERHELVTFTIDDKENPKNWSKGYKWYCTMVVAFTCFVVAFNSAVITADLAGVSKEFGVSDEVALLTISVRHPFLVSSATWTNTKQLFVIGFGVGPMVFAPLSESVGRRPIYAVTLLVALVFIIPCAVAKNIGKSERDSSPQGNSDGIRHSSGLSID